MSLRLVFDFIHIVHIPVTQGLLILYNLLGFLSLRLGFSPGLLWLMLVLICQDVAGRFRNYDIQDVINNVMMYGALVYLDTRMSSSLWLEMLCLSPAQLMR